LGTSTAADAKKYFSEMQHHCKKFSEIEQDDRKLLDMAFSKKNADKRKDWLKEYTVIIIIIIIIIIFIIIVIVIVVVAIYFFILVNFKIIIS